MKMITTDECEDCVHGVIEEISKSRVMVKCNARDKVYHYGQCIPCEYKEVRNNEYSD